MRATLALNGLNTMVMIIFNGGPMAGLFFQGFAFLVFL